MKDSYVYEGTNVLINIEGMEVDKYQYTNHTMEKLKTIEKPIDWKK